MDADCGGIVSYNNGYFLATNSHGILNLDKDFNIVAQHEVPYLDVHGLKMDSNSLLYLAESTHNTIGIYQPEPFKRVDEIKISEHDFDYNHINDLWIEGNRLFVSMFSYHDAWRELDGVYDGVILEYNLEEKALVNILQKNLMFPHSVTIFNESLHYCDSLNLNLKKDNEVLAQFSGFTRGLAFDGWNYYVGQSTMRHVNRVLVNHKNVSIDHGIHIFNPYRSTNRFLPLPAKQIYEILIINQEFYETSTLSSKVEMKDPLSIKYLNSPKDWHEPEQNYRWMASTRAGVKLYSNQPVFNLSINAHNYYSSDYSANVFINNKIIGEIRFNQNGSNTFHFKLTEPLEGNISIFFEVQNLWSPSRVIGNNDERNLGIAIEKIFLF
ncbi:TIGR03032 family protein [Paenibacillus sp. P25]|nr:TIGR03032 family protein [Paenibacillus sp. P25]